MSRRYCTGGFFVGGPLLFTGYSTYLAVSNFCWRVLRSFWIGASFVGLHRSHLHAEQQEDHKG